MWPVALILAAMPTLVSAQTTGDLSGYVYDANGRRLQGVSVTVYSSSSRQTTHTWASGFYSFIALSPGIYKVVVAAPEYYFYCHRPVAIWAGQSTSLDVGMTKERLSVTGCDSVPIRGPHRTSSVYSFGQAPEE